MKHKDLTQEEINKYGKLTREELGTELTEKIPPKNPKRHKDRIHSWLSPSGFHRAAACPASPVVSEGIETEPTEAALSGTKTHEWIEVLLKAAANKDPNVYAKQLFSFQNQDSDRASRADSYIDFLDGLKRRFQSDKFDEYEEYIETEGRFTPNIYGTLDYAICRRRKKGKWQAVIVDYKDGFNVVDAADNYQLILYLICLEEKLLVRFEKAWCYIYQPRVPRDKPYDKCVITREEIDEYRKYILEVEKQCIAMKRKEIPLEFHAGDHCKFCAFQVRCPTFKKSLSEESLMLLDGTNPTTGFEDQDIDILINIKKQKKQIEHYLENVDHYLYTRALRKQYVGDLKLVESQTKRRWIEDTEKVVIGLKKLGCNPYAKKVINIGEAERIVGKNKIDHLTTKPQGKLQLVDADDERESAQIGKKDIELLT